MVWENVTWTHKIYQVVATTTTRNTKPPTAPPAIGAVFLEDLEVCKAVTEFDASATVGVEAVVIMNILTTPSLSVDDRISVTTLGKVVAVIMIVVVITIVVGAKEYCVGVDWAEGMVLIGVDKQLAESVAVGSVTVMMLVTVKGSVIGEPVDASMPVLKKKP